MASFFVYFLACDSPLIIVYGFLENVFLVKHKQFEKLEGLVQSPFSFFSPSLSLSLWYYCYVVLMLYLILVKVVMVVVCCTLDNNEKGNSNRKKKSTPLIKC